MAYQDPVDVISGDTISSALWNQDVAENMRELYRMLFRGMGGRLSLNSANPEMHSSQTGATTLYYHPFITDTVTLWDGTDWIQYKLPSGGISFALSALGSSNTNYDIFVYNNAGTLALISEPWTNDTTRSVSLGKQDGIYVHGSNSQRRYVGTVRTDSTSGQVSFNAAARHLWNYYNKLDITASYADSTNHSYATATWREWNGASNVHQFSFVVGLDTWLDVNVIAGLSSTGAIGRVGVSLDGASPGNEYIGLAYSTTQRLGLSLPIQVADGRHRLLIYEYGGNLPTFDYAQISAHWMG